MRSGHFFTCALFFITAVVNAQIPQFTDISQQILPPLALSNHNLNTLAYADFNHDGIPDLLTVQAKQGIRLYSGQRDATFKSAYTETLNDFEISLLAPADFDNDANIDFAAITSTGQLILVENSPDGHVANFAVKDLSLPYNLHHLLWLDFNNDGLLDLSVLAKDGAHRVLLQRADHQFQELAFPHGIENIAFQLAVDLNGDFFTDLLFIDFDGHLRYFANNSMGGIVEKTQSLFPDIPADSIKSFAVSDVDNDGDTDLLIIFEQSAHILINAENNFASQALQLPNTESVSLANGTFIDYDSDGFEDLLLTGKQGQIFFKNAAGLRFEHTIIHESFPGSITAVAKIDFNADGRPDLVTTNTDGEISLFKNNTKSGKFINITLIGKQTNYYGIGAELIVETADKTIWRRNSFIRSNSGAISLPKLTIGLGDETRIKSITVNWPSGNTSQFFKKEAGINLVISEGDTEISLQKLKTGNRIAAAEAVSFTDISASAGIGGIPEYGGHAILFGDVDGDDLQDMYVTHTNFDPNNQGQFLVLPDELFINNGNLTFSERAQSAGVDDPGQTHGAVFADINNDGFLDLFNGQRGPSGNRLYQNDGLAAFSEITQSAGILPDDRLTIGVLALDIENDGDMDLFSGNWGLTNELYVNNGAGLFTIEDRGMNDLDNDPAGTMSPTAADIDNDGDMDVFLAKREGASRLYINDGSGFFTEEAASRGVNFTGIGSGAIFVDLDNDADLDMLLASAASSNPQDGQLTKLGIFSNDGNGFFTDQTNVANIPFSGYSIITGDVDNDGDQDLFLSINFGMSSLWLNDGTGLFTEQSGTGLERNRVDARATSMADIDNDGDLDIAITHIEEPTMLYQNNHSVAADFLQLEIRTAAGTAGNFGAKAWLYSAGNLDDINFLKGYQQLTSTTGTLSQNMPVLHFGVTPGSYDLKVRFLDGTEISQTNVASGQKIVINHVDNSAPVLSNIAVDSSLTDTAVISWNTNELATAQVEFGASQALGTFSDKITVLAVNHEISISGLVENTVYYYRVISEDASGNSTQSEIRSFTTAMQDATPPVISNVQISQITTNSAHISWETDEPASSQVEYGTSTNYGEFSPLDAALKTVHGITLNNLLSATLYHFRALSADGQGNNAASDDFTFVTLEGALLSDDFTGNSLDLTKWKKGLNSGNQAVVENDALHLRSQSNTSGWIYTFDNYIAEKIIAKVKIIQPNGDGVLGISPTVNPNSYSGFYDQPNRYRFYVYFSGTSGPFKLYVQWRKNGQIGGLDVADGVTFTNNFFLRLRMDDSSIYFEYSFDDINWITAYSEIFDLPGYSLTDAYFYELSAYHTPVKGELILDDFSLASTSPPAPDTTPPVISAVQANAITTNSAQIQWTTDEPADSRVEYGTTTALGTFTPLQTALVSSHNVALSGLTSETEYFYKVYSSDAAGNEAVTAVQSFLTAAEPPPDTTAPVISALQANAITTNSAQIQWTTDEPADSRVEYGITAALGAFTPVQTALVNNHTVALSGLTAETEYFYKVYSTDAAGNEAVSAVFSFVTTAAPTGEYKNVATLAVATASHETAAYGQVAASAIDGLLVSSGNYTNEWVENVSLAVGVWLQLDFSEQVSIDKVVLFDRSYASEWIQKFTLEFSDGSSLLYHGPNDALNNDGSATSYNFSSRTVTSVKFIIAGVSSTSEDVGLGEIEVYGFTGGTPADTTPPVISAIQALNIDTSSATINWMTDEAADSRVEYGLTFGLGQGTALNPVFETAHSEELTTLLPDTTYHYRVISRDNAGNESISAIATFKTLAPIAADTTAPVISAVQVTSITTNSAQIQWTTDEPSDSKIEYGLTTALGIFTPLQTVLMNNHTVALSGLTAELEYFYKVYSTDAAGNEAVSDIFSFITNPINTNPGPIHFTDISNTAGAETPSGPQGYGHGVAGADYNADGFIDIFVSNYDTSNALLINNRDGTFSDEAETWGVLGETNWFDRGIAAADYNNDGFNDFYLNIAGVSKLFRNEGNSHFIDATSSSGIFDNGQAQAAIWGDFNKDGLLDLISLNYNDPLRLFIQNNDHSFTNRTADFGLSNRNFSVSGVAFDVEGDGDTDIFISRGETYGNLLFINNGSNYFNEQGSQRGIDFPEMHGQGVTVADFDNDGDLDLFVCSDINSNKLFRNDGSGNFMDYTSTAGLTDNSRSTGCNFADFDNDGWLDIYVINYGQANRIYQNDGDGTFTLRSSTGSESTRNGYGSCLTDFDKDGDIDIFISNSGAKSQLFDNDAGSSNWLELNLSGQNSNKNGVGATLDLYFNNLHQRRAMLAGEGFVSGNILPVFTGLGPVDFADSVVVNWPAGGQTRLDAPLAGQRIEVIEGQIPIFNKKYDNDSTAPVISALQANAITTNSAQIQWTTDELADSRVEWGTTAALGTFTPLQTALVSSHNVALSGLADSTEYFYRAYSKDAAGNEAISAVLSFTTLVADTDPPVFTNIRAENITENSATILWNSDEPATSGVDYGITVNYDSSQSSAQMVVDHAINLTDLIGDQLYHFRVKGADSSGNETISGDFTFSTLADQIPPVISNIVVDAISPNSARINWQTDEPATSQVEYGTTSAYGDTSGLSSVLVTSHTVELLNLQANTEYHFMVHSQDGNNNSTSSTDQVFSTLPLGPISLFSDTFDGNSLDAAKWHKGTNTNNYSVVNNGFLELKSSNSQTGWVVTQQKFVPQNTEVIAKIMQPNGDGDLAISPTYSANATTGIFGENNWYRFYTYQAGGSNYLLYVQWRKNGVVNGLDVTGNLNITGEIYLRLRMDQTHIFFDASFDGIIWTETYNEPFALPGFTLQDEFHFALEAYKTDSKGDLIIDEFEILDVSTTAIRAINAASVSASTVLVNWQSVAATGAEIEFGTTPEFGSSIKLKPDLDRLHNSELTGLAPQTLYYYRTAIRDKFGQKYFGEVREFRTVLLADQKDVLHLEAEAIAQKSDGMLVDDGQSWQFSGNAVLREKIDFADGDIYWLKFRARGRSFDDEKTGVGIYLNEKRVSHLEITAADFTEYVVKMNVETGLQDLVIKADSDILTTDKIDKNVTLDWIEIRYNDLEMNNAVTENSSQIPQRFFISQNYPNPFNPQTYFDLTMPRNGDVSAIIYNIRGQEILRIFTGKLDAGQMTLTWSGRNNLGVPAPSGVYILRITAIMSTGEKHSATRRIMLLK
ncbi:MAG: T9SS C-terminal target domain-containing protein [Calditrichaeota bacterium]|nr:MAG: T9SS C-terminal target domain-containing protein [Calditrichota bacterium]